MDSTFPGMDRQPVSDVAITLGVLSQLFQSRMEVLLRPTGLTYTQLAVLSHLGHQTEGQSISALAEAFEIQQPGMSKVVQRLAASGAVTTQPDPKDPRRKLTSITDAGRSQFEAAGQAMEDDLNEWFNDWPDDELASFTASAGRLIGWLDSNRLG